MSTILPTIESPHDLQGLSPDELENLAAEMRQALCQVAASRTAHFASNLGVVELCLALHRVLTLAKTGSSGTLATKSIPTNLSRGDTTGSTQSGLVVVLWVSQTLLKALTTYS